MADFSHLKALDVNAGMTAEYTLHQITVNGKSPTLIVAPATDVNKPYFNALLKRSGKAARQVKAGKMTADLIDTNRDEDKELYPKHVVKGWRDMVDVETGGDLVFTPADCVSFLDALPNWIFDDCRTFCVEITNYTEPMDIEVLAKNLPSGSSST
jgi:hypothetical protein